MRALIIFIILSASIFGQSFKDVVDVRVLVLGNVSEMPERFLLTKEGYQKIVYSNRKASEVVKAYKGDSLPTFKQIEKQSSTAEYGIADIINVPRNLKSFLLLCWTSKNGEIRYLPIGDDISRANYNDWLFVNTTTKSVSFLIGMGSDPLVVKSNSIKSHIVRIDKDKGVPVVGNAPYNGKIKTFYSTYWKINGDERSMIIFTEVGDKIRATKIGDPLPKLKGSPTETKDSS